MRLTEPTTVVTDYLLGGMATWCGVRLLRTTRKRRQRSVLLWALGFLAAAGAAFTGGTAHGVKEIAAEQTQQRLWKSSLYAIGLTSFFLLAATIVSTLPRPWQRPLLIATGVKFAGFAAWMTTHDEFRYALYDYVTAMLGVLLLHGKDAAGPDAERARLIIGGLLVSFVAGGVQQSGFRRGQHFNHNDAYHLIQIGALYLFYQGGRLLEDR